MWDLKSGSTLALLADFPPVINGGLQLFSPPGKIPAAGCDRRAQFLLWRFLGWVNIRLRRRPTPTQSPFANRIFPTSAPKDAFPPSSSGTCAWSRSMNSRSLSVRLSIDSSWQPLLTLILCQTLCERSFKSPILSTLSEFLIGAACDILRRALIFSAWPVGSLMPARSFGGDVRRDTSYCRTEQSCNASGLGIRPSKRFPQSLVLF